MHPHIWVRHLFINIKHAFQRITKGYCDEDKWNLGFWMLEILPNMLDDLAQNSNGYPDNEEFDTFEKWQEYLKKLAADLRQCTEEAGDKMNPYYDEFVSSRSWHVEEDKIVWDKSLDEVEEIGKKYFSKVREIEAIQEETRENVFHELARNLLALWD